MESVTATSGHPLLMKAALDSAEQSQFECLECGTVDVSRTVTYSFQESQETNPDPCCCYPEASYLEKRQARCGPRVSVRGPHHHQVPARLHLS